MTLVLLFAAGALCGSLMNVCIYRLPRKESIVTPRSHCPYCGAKIAWFDNIPIISYLILRARCRACRKRISPRYIIVEVLAGFVCVLLYLSFGLSGEFFIFWYFIDALIVVSFIDFRVHEIPDIISLSGILLGLCVAFLYPAGLTFLDSLLGVIAGGGSIYLLGFFGEFIFKREAMGGGDVKLMAMIGAFLGWKLVLFTFFLAPFFGVIPGIALKIRKKRDIMPYGPYLSLAAVVAIFWGEKIIRKLFLI